MVFPPVYATVGKDITTNVMGESPCSIGAYGKQLTDRKAVLNDVVGAR
jgi:hypothetical protein